MNSFWLSLLCLIVTVVIYYLNKWLYRRWRHLLLMPLVLTPAILVLGLLLTNIPWSEYNLNNQWLVWLLGPATLAFAVPIYGNILLLRRHWRSLMLGVVTAVIMAVLSSVLLAKLLSLPEFLQRSLAVRSITTPFALAAAKQVGGEPSLVALFVVITGVFGMAVGEIIFLCLAIKQDIAIGAAFGAAAHGAGTARAYQISPTTGVISSLVMMLAGISTILLAPLINIIIGMIN